MTAKHAAKFKPHFHIGKTGHVVVAAGYFTAALFFKGHSAELMAGAYGTAAAIEAHETRHHTQPSHEA